MAPSRSVRRAGRSIAAATLRARRHALRAARRATPPPSRPGQPMVEALRIIRYEEPSRLSAVSQPFRGDVETIAAKAWPRSRTPLPHGRRHASDIRRYLNDEPIVARPPSTWYQVRKFARRHRGLSSRPRRPCSSCSSWDGRGDDVRHARGRQRALFEHEAYRSAIAPPRRRDPSQRRGGAPRRSRRDDPAFPRVGVALPCGNVADRSHSRSTSTRSTRGSRSPETAGACAVSG